MHMHIYRFEEFISILTEKVASYNHIKKLEIDFVKKTMLKQF